MRTLQEALCTVTAIRRLVELGAVKLDADMQDQLALADEIERLREALRRLMLCDIAEVRTITGSPGALANAREVLRPNVERNRPGGGLPPEGPVDGSVRPQTEE